MFHTSGIMLIMIAALNAAHATANHALAFGKK
jgi:hypothetical protein